MSAVTAAKSKGNEIDTGTQRDLLSSRFVRQRLQSFLLIWLDIDLDESREDVQQSMEQLRYQVLAVTVFNDLDECIDFLSDTTEERVFLITSDSLGQQLISNVQINTWQQIDYIYIFSSDKITHATWMANIPKLRGIYTQIESICKTLQTDCQTTDRATMPLSFNGIDPLFMYTQFLKEAFLELEDDGKKSINEFAEYCRLQDVSKKIIEQFAQEYPQPSPIWWYTGPFFIYSMLNRGLRQMDVEIILKMGFFIRHLHNNLQELYAEQQCISAHVATSFTVYRGQGLSLENFDKMKRSEGNFMSFNNFLSTTCDRDIALEYAQPGALHVEPIGILFVMTISPEIGRKSSIPFIYVKNAGYFNNQEEEILFTTHTIFRIDNIQHIPDHPTNDIWKVELTLVDNEDPQFNLLISHMRNELNTRKGWSRIAVILLNIGEPTKAASLLNILLENANNDYDKEKYYSQLALVYRDIGDYEMANVCLEEVLNYQKGALPPNHSDFAPTYNNIGLVYDSMGEYSKALASYERALETIMIALPPHHPDLAASYNNIGLVYDHMGEYSEALSSFKRALKVMKKILPPNHPSLATSYNNIGLVYYNMGEYSKALSSYERALEIRKTSLPPTHYDLAGSYNNIGSVHFHVGDYTKALSSFERGLEIMQINLPANHPNLAGSYNNIGSVYFNRGDYSKALSSFKRGLEIQKIALPPNHPSLATSYNNIGLVYDHMGDYSKALSTLERGLEIIKIALPPNHPSISIYYSNIGWVRSQMGDYSNALSLYERGLEIMKISLPANHPSLATAYSNIGSTYSQIGDYPKALSSFERGLKIMKISLPANHPELATSYNNIGYVYFQMSDYSKAITYFERALEIMKVVLPSNHPALASCYVNISAACIRLGH